MKMSKKLAREIVDADIVDQYRRYVAVYSDSDWSDFINSLVRRECRRVLAKKGRGK